MESDTRPDLQQYANDNDRNHDDDCHYDDDRIGIMMNALFTNDDYDHHDDHIVHK